MSRPAAASAGGHLDPCPSCPENCLTQSEEALEYLDPPRAHEFQHLRALPNALQFFRSEPHDLGLGREPLQGVGVRLDEPCSDLFACSLKDAFCPVSPELPVGQRIR